MATKKSKGLGMVLEALLGPKVSDTPAAAASEGSPTTLRLDLMQAGKYQPRTRMDEGSLYELAESIRSQGIMQPILVRPIGEGRYEIIAGERRSRAAKLAGLSEVPVLVKDVPDEAAAAMAQSLAQGYSAACPNGMNAVDLGSPAITGAEVVIAGWLACDQVNGNGQSEAMVVLIMVTGGTIYTAQWAEHVPATDGPPIFDQGLWMPRLDTLMTFSF